MARLVVLDAGPIGLLCQRRGIVEVDRCSRWVRQLELSGSIICTPEIVVYEVKRELIRLGALPNLFNLKQLIDRSLYLPITTPIMERAADLWAGVRRRGVPTASPDSLDADCILAAQALDVSGVGDVTSIATTNAVHLIRFPGVDARHWDTIV